MLRHSIRIKTQTRSREYSNVHTQKTLERTTNLHDDGVIAYGYFFAFDATLLCCTQDTELAHFRTIALRLNQPTRREAANKPRADDAKSDGNLYTR